MKEIRIVIDGPDFGVLVAGGEVLKFGLDGEKVRFIFSDIGWDVMEHYIDQASRSAADGRSWCPKHGKLLCNCPDSPSF